MGFAPRPPLGRNGIQANRNRKTLAAQKPTTENGFGFPGEVKCRGIAAEPRQQKREPRGTPGALLWGSHTTEEDRE
jgi:hypothetical protein